MLELITAPSAEPIEYWDIVHHLKMDLLDESMDESSQTYIDRLIASVRKECEAFTNRAFITQTWNYYLQAWPSENYIEIPKPPLQSVASVAYYDTNGTEYPFSTSYYTVDTKSIKGRIVLKPNQMWPTASLYSSNPIKIQFVCGYGNTAEDVEPAIRHAITVAVGDLWDNRQDYRKELTLPRASMMLLYPYRVICNP